MSKYELTFLLNEEKGLTGIEELFQTHSAKLQDKEKWGKRSLSYPIKKNSSAYFFTYKFEIDPKELKELKRKMNFNEGILRYLLIKL